MNKLISIKDLSCGQIHSIFELSKKMKADPSAYADKLKGHRYGLIFEKPSTRTRVSFFVGIQSLGGGSLYLGPNDIQLGEREEVKDVARVLDRYLSGAVLRTYEHGTIEEFSQYFSKPVINGLSDLEHPCQALADYFTIQENTDDLKKPVLAFVGDGNNVLHSLLLVAAKLGAKIRYATPKVDRPSAAICAAAQALAQQTGAVIEEAPNAQEAVKGADFIYTDVWVSMGEEDTRKEKLKHFDGLQVNDALLKLASKNVKVMHCLPAHRGEEITDSVIESSHSIVFDQAENRMHVQKAILHFLNQSS